MKLLIVDDEKLTREGLRDSIDWSGLGIRQVDCADDGLNGLERAASLLPDIVLSDVRMPRMTGIEMCEKIQESNPNVRIIFMSGYSDKEYLKAAIRLHAVNYVEKPINTDEISQAVREAVEEITEDRINEAGKIQNLSLEKNKIALELCQLNKGRIQSYSEIASWDCMYTVLIKVYHNTMPPESVLEQIRTFIEPVFEQHYISNIHCYRPGYINVFHLWGFKTYSDSQKKVLAEELADVLRKTDLHFHIVFGKNVDDISKVFQSYNSAVIELQTCFFEKSNTYRIYHSGQTREDFPVLSEDESDKELRTILLGGKAEEYNHFMDKQMQKILGYDSILPNQVKDLFYKYFSVLKEVGNILGMKTDGREDSYWGMISECESVYELADLLKEKTDDFFARTKERSDSGSTVAMIREYINMNYGNYSLSIKDISEHVYLSTSYICTLFKNETGQTLNQYITEFRINKAKELLRDPRNKVNDISTIVGYSDGNYFGKTFKKQVGMSPTEYRDKNQ